MVNKRLHIALIDSSICFDCDNNFGVNMVQMDGVTTPKSATISHGTICLNIIKKYVKKFGLDVLITCIPILDNDCMGDVDNLLSAIDWCKMNNVDIINLSLGTRNYNEFARITAQINDAYYKFGIIFVCAASNSGRLSFPSYLTNTIGVNTKEGLAEGEVWLAHHNELGINITAYSEHTIRLNEIIIKTRANNSYAAPFVTAVVAKYLDKNYCKRNITDILLQFGDNSLHIMQTNRFDWLYNVAIYDDEHSQYDYKFPVYPLTMDHYNEVNRDVEAVVLIRKLTFFSKELTTLLVFKRSEDSFEPYIWYPKRIFKNELSLLATKAQAPVIISILAYSGSNTTLLINRVGILLTEQGFRVYTITNNIRNLLNDEGVVAKGIIYSSNLEIKLENSLIDLILVDESGYSEDLTFKIDVPNDNCNERVITYSLNSEQKSEILFSRCPDIEELLVEIILRVFE